MSINKIFFTLIAGGSIVLLSIGSDANETATSYDLNSEDKFGNGNEPVHVAGCRTYDPPVAPTVVYPTVSKNFRTLLCALEVPPPVGVLVLQRSNVNTQ